MDDDECPICYDKFTGVNVSVLDCSHKFHFKCIAEWSRQRYDCPMCRCNLVKGRNPANIPRAPTAEQRRIIDADANQIPLCTKIIDRIKLIFKWMICSIIVYLVVVMILVNVVIWKRNSDCGAIVRHAIINDNFTEASLAFDDISYDSVAADLLDDAIRFNRVEIVKMIIDKHSFADAGKYSKALRYAEFNKNEIIIDYIRRKNAFRSRHR